MLDTTDVIYSEEAMNFLKRIDNLGLKNKDLIQFLKENGINIEPIKIIFPKEITGITSFTKEVLPYSEIFEFAKKLNIDVTITKSAHKGKIIYMGIVNFSSGDIIRNTGSYYSEAICKYNIAQEIGGLLQELRIGHEGP